MKYDIMEDTVTLKEIGRDLSAIVWYKKAPELSETIDKLTPKKEDDMSEDLIREILGMDAEDAEIPSLKTPIEDGVKKSYEPPALASSTEDLGDGKSVTYKPFSEVFGWKPVIDHLVATYKEIGRASCRERV